MKKIILLCLLTLGLITLISCGDSLNKKTITYNDEDNIIQDSANNNNGSVDGYPELPTEQIDGKFFFFSPNPYRSMYSDRHDCLYYGGIYYRELLLDYAEEGNLKRGPANIRFLDTASIRRDLGAPRYGFRLYNINYSDFVYFINKRGLNDCDKLYEELYKTLYYQAIKEYRDSKDQDMERAELVKNVLDAFKNRNILFYISQELTYYDPKCSN